MRFIFYGIGCKTVFSYENKTVFGTVIEVDIEPFALYWIGGSACMRLHCGILSP